MQRHMHVGSCENAHFKQATSAFRGMFDHSQAGACWPSWIARRYSAAG